MPDHRVLVWPGGTEIGMEIHHALSQVKNIRLFSAGSGVPNHADCVFAHHAILPAVCEHGWLDRLNRLLAEHGIDYIFPAHDDVLLALAEAAEQLQARVVTSPLETCRIARFKSATYRCLEGTLPVPELYSHGGEEISRYPVFVKPDRGQGSQGIQIAGTREELISALGKLPGSIAVEYLPGEEYTVDCFSDRERGLLFCGGRERVRTRNGISMQTRPVRDPVFEVYGRAISARLKFHGAWFFQVKRDRNGILKLLEVAPRIAGAMALHRVLGVNFPLLSIYEQERIPVRILMSKLTVELDRALVNRYRHDLRWSCVYVDLDDTLVLNGKVNTQLVRFLYQCINRGCRIVLLTRHSGCLEAALDCHRLAGIFDQTIHLGEGDVKSAYIREKDALLIDDSFREREAAARACGIATFDPSQIELLIDERE